MMEVLIVLFFIIGISLLIGNIGARSIDNPESGFNKKDLKRIRANFERKWAAKLEREKNLKYEPKKSSRQLAKEKKKAWKEYFNRVLIADDEEYGGFD